MTTILQTTADFLLGLSNEAGPLPDRGCPGNALRVDGMTRSLLPAFLMCERKHRWEDYTMSMRSTTPERTTRRSAWGPSRSWQLAPCSPPVAPMLRAVPASALRWLGRRAAAGAATPSHTRGR